MDESNKKLEDKKLAGKEVYEFRKSQKKGALSEAHLNGYSSWRVPKKIGKYFLYLLIAGVIGGFGWFIITSPTISESDIVSRGAFHWHPELTIYVKGVKQEIPPNIGIGAVHQPVHTHDDSDQGIVHLEFPGLVQKQDITLGQFFESWGKDIRSFGSNMKMIVNGKESTEYENYVMHDKDKIELRYN